MKKENVISDNDIRIIKTKKEYNHNWVDVCNRWFNGGTVTEKEIVDLATMNMIDFTHTERMLVADVVKTFCREYAEVWSDGNYPESWGWRFPSGAVIKTQYGGIAGNYWNNEDHYSIAE